MTNQNTSSAGEGKILTGEQSPSLSPSSAVQNPEEMLKKVRELAKLNPPFCIGIVQKEEAEILDCEEGVEYALFKQEDRSPLIHWFGGDYSMQDIAQAFEKMYSDCCVLSEMLQKVRDCDVPFELDNTVFLGLREEAAKALSQTSPYPKPK